ncbi:hypothetical protein [Pseudanabaena sp. FACHB-2040]|uniref:hypothetical protein n=1 Tax=Pseudanabaena sp. FACHB-2040 TaxID=2692859 RepID=UPI0016848B22|nr:hypothetical protein [Pseudanabaena sp. FACHB-2040]MBD2256083.1 hypothetical protein [Pseudanabaena sp. FACHB-2040]
MDRQNDHARDSLAHQRLQADQRQNAMRTRTEAEMHQADSSNLEEQSRATLARQRQHSEHLQDTLRERTEEEIE